MRNGPAQPRAKRAFTLLEAVIGMFLALTCALIFAAAMPAAQASRHKANLNNVARVLAEQQLETIRARGYPGVDAIELAKDEPEKGNPALLDSSTAVSANTYSWTNISTGSNDSPAELLPGGEAFVRIEQIEIDLRRLSVFLRWEQNGQEAEVFLSTLVANN